MAEELKILITTRGGVKFANSLRKLQMTNEERLFRKVYLVAWAAVAAGLALALAVFLAAVLSGCGNPCDSRPGYEHPRPAHKEWMDAPPPPEPASDRQVASSQDGGTAETAHSGALAGLLRQGHRETRPADTTHRLRQAPVGRPPSFTRFRVTAYCPCRICCGPKARGVTASGRPARGLVVAAPPKIPFGVLAYVPGYGMAKVADRGGAIQGNRLDVLLPTHAEARAWGVRYLAVHFDQRRGA